MNLRVFRLKNKIGMPKMARAIGITTRAAYFYEAGNRIPRPRIMARIFKFTGGKVTPADFYDAPLLIKRGGNNVKSKPP